MTDIVNLLPGTVPVVVIILILVRRLRRVSLTVDL
jgi:hypothetical protein